MNDPQLMAFCERFREFLEDEASQDIDASSVEDGVRLLANRVTTMSSATAFMLGRWTQNRSLQHDLGEDIILHLQDQIKQGADSVDSALNGETPLWVGTTIHVTQ